MMMNEVVLYDIFPEVEIVTHLPIEGIFLTAIAIFLILLYLHQERKRKRSADQKNKTLTILKNLNWDDPRTAAHRLEHYAPLHIQNGIQKDTFKKIVSGLHLQKYHPNPPTLSQGQAIMIERFIKDLGKKDV